MSNAATTVTSIRVDFEGMMVLHQDRRDGHYEMGILKSAPQHGLKIRVTPDPAKGSGELTPTREDIERLRRLGNSWLLEVTDVKTGEPRKEILANPTCPTNRHDPNGDLKELGWIIDLESDEFHDRELALRPGLLGPILHLSNGRLYTFCKTNGVDIIQGSRGIRRFGFISETISLGINIRPDEQVTLKVDAAGAEGGIFTIPYNPTTPYVVSIMNTAVGDHGDETSHFKDYYELFPDVPESERVKLRLTEPEELSPNICASVKPHEHKGGGVGIRTVNPYLCGSILLGRSDTPLK